MAEQHPEKVLSVSGLNKRFGETVAVNDVSFEVGRNEIVGLLGPNGAGKTTTINMILGVLEPSSGWTRSTSPTRAASSPRAMPSAW